MTDQDSGLFVFPGGHIEPGEAPLQAATREYREEMGTDVPGTLTDVWTSADGGAVGFVFEVDDEDEVTLCADGQDPADSSRAATYAWWDVGEAQSSGMVSEDVKQRTCWDVVGGVG